MGWCCTSEAAKTEQKWSEGCHKTTGSSNTFTNGKDRYFYEVTRKSHADGAITGTIYRCIGEDHARKVGSFRIEGNGKIARAPQTLKQFAG